MKEIYNWIYLFYTSVSATCKTTIILLDGKRVKLQVNLFDQFSHFFSRSSIHIRLRFHNVLIALFFLLSLIAKLRVLLISSHSASPLRFSKFHTSLICCHATVALMRPHVKLKTITIAYYNPSDLGCKWTRSLLHNHTKLFARRTRHHSGVRHHKQVELRGNQQMAKGGGRARARSAKSARGQSTASRV